MVVRSPSQTTNHKPSITHHITYTSPPPYYRVHPITTAFAKANYYIPKWPTYNLIILVSPSSCSGAALNYVYILHFAPNILAGVERIFPIRTNI